MRTHTICNLLFLLALAMKSSFGAEALVHPRIDVGASFLFSQIVEEPGVKKGPYWPRLDAWNRNGAGGVIFTIASGPKKELPKNAILQTVFGLDPKACVVDVFAGRALAKGTSCDHPLPTDQSWVVTDREGTTLSCQLMQPRQARVRVPAGEFEATKIECRENFVAPSKHQVTEYWYVASIGSMAKTVYRNLDAAGAESSVITMELASYQVQ